MNDYLNNFEYFKLLPILVKLIWFLCIVLFLFILGLICYLKVLRIRLRKNELRRNKLEKIYEENLINYLYAGDDVNEISDDQQLLINKIKKNISNEFNRDILISVMSKLVNDISGEMAFSIHRLYVETGLIDYSLQKLKAKKWEVIASGIRELTQFEVKQVNNEIQDLIKHPNEEIRNQAQLYLVSVFQFKGLKFLNNLNYQLSEWNQIQLLEILQKFDNQEISDITLWLKSTNISVVEFALKLTKVYNKFESKETLLELLKHKNEEIRVHAINVLSYFHDSDCKEFLKFNFKNSSENEQISFLKLLENVADSTDENFILESINHHNFEIKLVALKILKAINVSKFNNLTLEENDIQGQEIIKFISTN